MPNKNDLFDFDETTALNNDNVQGANIAENCAPSGINNAIRGLASIVKRAIGSQGSPIASAATTAIAAAGTALYATVTGTTAITGLGTVGAGTFRIVEFTGALTLTHNATSLKLPGGANIATSPGDVGFFLSLGGGNWKCLHFARADGAAVTTPVIAVAAAVTPDAGAVVAGTAVKTFRMPFAFTLTAVRASLATAQATGAILTVDINEGGTTILSTKLTIDNTEKTSTTAATAAVISDAALADDAEITIDVDQVGDGTAKGLTVYLVGRKP